MVRDSTAASAKPRVFIGSSTEGLEIARACQSHLDEIADVTVWKDGVGSIFRISCGFLEGLVDAVSSFDFGLFVLTPDETVVSRGLPAVQPRGNVVFELGLFMGHLGRGRVFALLDFERTSLPSDWQGVMTLPYNSTRADKQWKPAVAEAMRLLSEQIRRLGPSELQHSSMLKEAAVEVGVLSAVASRLVQLLARSRVVELDVLTHQFAGLLPTGQVEEMKRDLVDLQNEIAQSSAEVFDSLDTRALRKLRQAFSGSDGASPDYYIESAHNCTHMDIERWLFRKWAERDSNGSIRLTPEGIARVAAANG